MEKMKLLELWMATVGVVMALCCIPQIIRLYKLKTAEEMSITYWAVANFSVTQWLMYGWIIDSPSIIVTTIVDSTLCITILSQIIFYRMKHRKRGTRNE